jgi:hypothetical protein
MAIAKPAHCTYRGCETAKTNGLSSLASIRTIFVVVCAMGVTGCAHYPAQRDLEAMNAAHRVAWATSVRVRTHVRVYSKERKHAELRGRQPDPSLLAPQPAPSCDFKVTDGTELGEWTQADLAWQCYRDAEKASRKRLDQLQAYLRSRTDIAGMKRAAEIDRR